MPVFSRWSSQLQFSYFLFSLSFYRRPCRGGSVVWRKYFWSFPIYSHTQSMHLVRNPVEARITIHQ